MANAFIYNQNEKGANSSEAAAHIVELRASIREIERLSTHEIERVLKEGKLSSNEHAEAVRLIIATGNVSSLAVDELNKSAGNAAERVHGTNDKPINLKDSESNSDPKEPAASIDRSSVFIGWAIKDLAVGAKRVDMRPESIHRPEEIKFERADSQIVADTIKRGDAESGASSIPLQTHTNTREYKKVKSAVDSVSSYLDRLKRNYQSMMTEAKKKKRGFPSGRGISLKSRKQFDILIDYTNPEIKRAAQLILKFEDIVSPTFTIAKLNKMVENTVAAIPRTTSAAGCEVYSESIASDYYKIFSFNNKPSKFAYVLTIGHLEGRLLTPEEQKVSESLARERERREEEAYQAKHEQEERERWLRAIYPTSPPRASWTDGI